MVGAISKLKDIKATEHSKLNVDVLSMAGQLVVDATASTTITITTATVATVTITTQAIIMITTKSKVVGIIAAIPKHFGFVFDRRGC